MRFEVLKRSNLKRNIIIGVVVVAIIIVCVITLTRAKYRTVASTTLIKGEVNYTLADLNLVAVYLQKEEGGTEYTPSAEIPESGYYLNTEESYCEVNDTQSDSISLSYDMSFRILTVSSITTQGTKCYLYFNQGTLLRDAILTGKAFETRELPFSTSYRVTTTQTGVIYMSGDEENEYDYDNDGVVYYFAGNPPDNYVEFAEVYWRIVRINGDGTIRLIYQGKSATATGSNTTIGRNTFNEDADASYYVGYTYSVGYQRGNDSESTIKKELDDWYYNNIVVNELEDYIADSGFCGDREVASGYSWVSSGKTFYYAAYERLSSSSNVIPTFKCSDADLYTTSTSDKGNGALTYPIGLITADEIVYAGLNGSSINYLAIDNYYWTMSPAYFYSASSGYAYVFIVSDINTLVASHTVRESWYIRPVINLSADVIISGGDGTSSSPYVVSVQ